MAISGSTARSAPSANFAQPLMQSLFGVLVVKNFTDEGYGEFITFHAGMVRVFRCDNTAMETRSRLPIDSLSQWNPSVSMG